MNRTFLCLNARENFDNRCRMHCFFTTETKKCSFADFIVFLCVFSSRCTFRIQGLSHIFVFSTRFPLHNFNKYCTFRFYFSSTAATLHHHQGRRENDHSRYDDSVVFPIYKNVVLSLSSLSFPTTHCKDIAVVKRWE